MRICIDVQSAIAQRAGVGRYTRHLVQNLGALAKNDELSLFYFDFMRKGIPFDAPNATQRPIRWCPGRIAQDLAGRADVVKLHPHVVARHAVEERAAGIEGQRSWPKCCLLLMSALSDVESWSRKTWFGVTRRLVRMPSEAAFFCC